MVYVDHGNIDLHSAICLGITANDSKYNIPTLTSTSVLTLGDGTSDKSSRGNQSK